MDAPTASDQFRLARVSRARTVKRDKRPQWSELLSQAAFIVMMALTFSGPWTAGQADPALSEIRQAGYLGVFLASLLAIRPWRHPQNLLVVPWPLLLALGWCWFSLTWAMFPASGLRRIILTSIVAWSTFILVREIGFERLVTILRALLVALLIANYVAVLVYPEIGVDPQDFEGTINTWRGVMDQKNFVGFACAMTVIMFFFNTGFPALSEPAGRALAGVRIVVVCAAAFFLVQSQSKTSMGICLFALIVGALFAYLAQRKSRGRLAMPGWAWLALVPFALICVSMAVDPAPYLELVSDQSGFTGRNLIWTGLIKAYVEQPWLGVGYGSLWDVGDDGPMKVYASGFAREVSQGHNGYLDMLVQIGAPGTLLVIFAVLVWPLQRLLRGGDHPARVLGVAILAFCLGHNSTESTLFDRDTQGQVFLMIALALLWGTTASTGVAREDGR